MITNANTDMVILPLIVSWYKRFISRMLNFPFLLFASCPADWLVPFSFLITSYPSGILYFIRSISDMGLAFASLYAVYWHVFTI